MLIALKHHENDHSLKAKLDIHSIITLVVHAANTVSLPQRINKSFQKINKVNFDIEHTSTGTFHQFVGGPYLPWISMMQRIDYHFKITMKLVPVTCLYADTDFQMQDSKQLRHI